MSIEIEILTGHASKPQMQPLHDLVWPQAVLDQKPWRHLQFASADLRVFLEVDGVLACHIGIYWREVMWNGRKARVGGIGDVMTHPDYRGRGLATLGLNAAIHTFKDERATEFALLFCDADMAPFYAARNWKPFEGEVFAEQSGERSRLILMQPYVHYLKRAPHQGELDLCGLPW
jgi:aminoglycoside 2'-N-acetyltransferase I